MAKRTHFHFGEDHLTAKIALDIARGSTRGVLSQACLQKVDTSHQRVLKIVEKGEVVYGINTGFGPLCNTKISQKDTKILQSNILQSQDRKSTRLNSSHVKI